MDRGTRDLAMRCQPRRQRYAPDIVATVVPCRRVGWIGRRQLAVAVVVKRALVATQLGTHGMGAGVHGIAQVDGRAPAIMAMKGDGQAIWLLGIVLDAEH